MNKDTDNGFTLILSSRSSDTNVSNYYGRAGTSSGNSNVWIVKTVENGNILWGSCYSGESRD